MRRLLAILLTMFSLDATAQVVVSGIVTSEKSGTALLGVSVMLRTSAGGVVGFDITNDKGSYSISYTGSVDTLIIVATSPTITTYSARIKAATVRHDIKVIDGAIEIKEVRVEAPSIGRRGDTLSYNVAAFADASDRSIGEVIAKMPGLEVDKNGKVRYNGTAINIKLKKGVKGTFNLSALLGIGYGPLQWKAELAAMYFGRKFQTYNSD